MIIKKTCILLLLTLFMHGASLRVSAKEDTELLARAVEATASGESYTVMASVAAVLLNRMKSGSYPCSLGAVISDAGIDVSHVTPSRRAMKAAADAAGGFDPTSGALRYTREGASGAPPLLGTDGWSFY